MYDLIVCGAGPIGSYLGLRFSKRGYKTLVLEEHSEIGKPLACSGLMSKRLWDFIPYNKKLIEKEIEGARIHLDKNVYTFRSNQAIVVNRVSLDRYMYKLAVERGAEYSLLSRLINFFEEGDKVSIYYKNKGKIINVHSRLLAGTDGPLSKVRKILNLREPNYLQGVFTYVEEEGDSFVDIYLKDSPGFFVWKIPRSMGLMEYGIASNRRAIFYFRKFMRKKGIKPRKIYSGLIPYGLLPSITSRRVFLCGDAASQVKPYSGGGVIYGLTSAKIASDVICPKNPNMKEYESRWRNEIGKEIKTGMWIKRFYRLPSPLLKIMLNILSKKKGLDMDKPSTILGD
ncbi:MAG: NAD(P)/FAD-dependent oxidoreductase [Candidatus Aenigmarchaeota archaeon]|nr:NAD(P)/FAD-dependent oxidoreductase [Candidatus Aenigmarchaeota archaeon]